MPQSAVNLMATFGIGMINPRRSVRGPQGDDSVMPQPCDEGEILSVSVQDSCDKSMAIDLRPEPFRFQSRFDNQSLVINLMPARSIDELKRT